MATGMPTGTAMTEMLSEPFMQRALLAGLLVSGVAGYYGAFVVQRGLGFLGNGLAHAAFGGVALGLLLNLQPLAVAVPFTVAVALLILWVQERAKLGGDTAIGILFALSMALGVIFLSMRQTFSSDAMTYLFGSIIAVGWADVWMSAGALALALLLAPLWPRWAYATFDRELATADRQPVRSDDALLYMALAVTIVTASKVVGLILVAAFLVIPAATARLLVRRFSSMTVVGVLLGAASVVAGLMASWKFDLPPGATIVVAQCLGFAAAMAGAKLRG
jgi:zinc transport system permease protein